jgi:outer membrane protein OmpA-like peptidoglycan-associated protein
MSVPSRPRGLFVAVLFAVAGLALPASAVAQTVEGQVDAVGEELNEARSQQLHLIAPRHFQRAAEKLSEARQRLEEGRSINDIRDRLAEARQALSRAAELREVGSVLLRDAMAAREDALAANAPDFAPEIWEEGASRLHEAGREVEDGDQNDARQKAAEAQTKFREAERTAIERSLLGDARELRQRARDGDAHEKAPRTYARADSLLGDADAALRQGPSGQQRAGELAESSADQFRHALRIAAQADTFDRDDGVEALMLRSEQQIARVAETLDFEPRFSDGLASATEQVLAAVRSLQEDRSALEERVAGLRADLDEADGRIDSLRQRLAQLGEEQAEVSAQLAERRRQEERLRAIRGIFSPDEAEVLIRGDELHLRLLGLQFASGSAEIRPDHFSLLTKVRRAIRELPDAPIVVQGHTDARGNDEYNQSLSQRRAIAVREYLLANMSMSADRIRAEGYGETEPIATNDTEEGRSKNRRIDIVLEMPGR